MDLVERRNQILRYAQNDSHRMRVRDESRRTQREDRRRAKEAFA